MARALPADGKRVTIEKNPQHAKVAQDNLRNAGVDQKVDLHIGSAVVHAPEGPLLRVTKDRSGSAADIPAEGPSASTISWPFVITDTLPWQSGHLPSTP